MIYSIINTVGYVILAQIFCSAFIEREEMSAFFSGMTTILWIMLGSAVSILLEEVLVIRIILAIMLNILFFLILYKKNRLVKTIAVAILFYVTGLSCEILVVAIHKYFDPELKIEKLMDSKIYVYMGVVSQFMELIVVFIIRKIFRKVRTAKIESKLWMIYTIFPLYSVSLVVLLGYSFDGPISFSQANAFTYIASSLLLINLFIYWFIQQESRRALDAQKNDIEIAHAEGIVQLYDQITKERDVLGKREHEFKNTISALQGLYANKQYDKMGEILGVQNTELINNTNVFETGNRLINTILNTKYVEAREKDITFRFVINDLSKLIIADRDCIVILSNMINNAIEAAEKCPEGKRIIFVKAVIEGGKFIFACRNSYINDLDPEMRSKKKDVVSHGYGIENIKEAVNRNKGSCIFSKEGQEFVAVVILPIG
ncbi:MAG: GHKL domain-containing protein [Clostridiales bacterium]|nr:GHKL domain-containing protein [Clostridiales bacterium]